MVDGKRYANHGKDLIRKLSGREQTPYRSVGEVVIIQEESRDRNIWKLGIVEELIVGRDGIVYVRPRYGQEKDS